MTTRPLHLPSEAPGEWLTRHICTHLTPEQRRQATPTDELIARGWFAGEFERHRARGLPRSYVAHRLAAAFGGTLGLELGYAYAASGAGFAPAPEATTWILHDGDVDGVAFPPDTPAATLPDHPWAHRPEVTVATDLDHLLRLTARAVADAARPVIDHLATITGAARRGLWQEVGDAIPSVATWTNPFPLTDELVHDLNAMLCPGDLPWRTGPTIDLHAEGDHTTGIKHRAGCCLKYLARRDRDPAPTGAKAEFHQRFPITDPTRVYCDDCKLHTADERCARQLWWWRRSLHPPEDP